MTRFAEKMEKKQKKNGEKKNSLFFQIHETKKISNRIQKNLIPKSDSKKIRFFWNRKQPPKYSENTTPKYDPKKNHILKKKDLSAKKKRLHFTPASHPPNYASEKFDFAFFRQMTSPPKKARI